MIEALSLTSLFLAILIVVFITFGIYAVLEEKKYKKDKVPFSKSLN